MKFRVEYRGRFSGAWTETIARGERCGANGQRSGTVDSMLSTGPRPIVVEVNAIGGQLTLRWYQDHYPKGIVTVTTTAQGWYQGDDCYIGGSGPPQPKPIDTADCGTKTFPGDVAILAGEARRRKLELGWQLEPPREHEGACPKRELYDMREGDPWKLTAQAFDWRRLLRCGQRRPRDCRRKVSGARSFSIDEQYRWPTHGELVTATGSNRLEWSVTFVAIGAR